MSEDPLRIAIVHPYPWPTVRRGGERYLHDLTWYLRGQGHNVTVITGSANTTRADGADRYVRFPNSRLLKAFGMTDLESFGLPVLPALRRERFDVVHALVPTAGLAAKLAQQTTVYTAIGPPPRRPKIRGRGLVGIGDGLRYKVFGLAMTRANQVTVLSNHNADVVRQRYNLEPAVVPPGIRIDEFPLVETRSGPPRVLFASALIPHKGLDLVVRAFARILERRPDARLGLSGLGDHRWVFDRLRDEKDDVERSIDVLGVGSPEELPSVYGSADVTVLASRNEAFGLVLIESLACGTPVVATLPGGPADIIDNDAVGRLAPHGDHEALAAAIDEAIDLAREPATPQTCRAHAARWSWTEHVGPAHERVYLETISGARG
ncbi:MAG: glycosyltransferase family 4 protein [Actinomycetota bacterium]